MYSAWSLQPHCHDRQLVLFSTELAMPDCPTRPIGPPLGLRKDSESEPINIEEIDTMFVIGWKGRHRIEADRPRLFRSSYRSDHYHPRSPNRQTCVDS
jgi:hypothetical protein